MIPFDLELKIPIFYSTEIIWTRIKKCKEEKSMHYIYMIIIIIIRYETKINREMGIFQKKTCDEKKPDRLGLSFRVTEAAT